MEGERIALPGGLGMMMAMLAHQHQHQRHQEEEEESDEDVFPLQFGGGIRKRALLSDGNGENKRSCGRVIMWSEAMKDEMTKVFIPLYY